MLAGVRTLGGDLLAQKMIGVVLATLAAAALFVITARLADFDPSDRDGDAAPDGVGAPLLPVSDAVVATLLYALWPAGVAMASVVGTDVPAAALICSRSGLLVALGARRPIAAALALRRAMGLGGLGARGGAAAVGAVARLLGGAARRKSWRAVALLTALATAATLVVLLPWAVRNLRQHGALYFTDDHGGITALIGANPNSEGTYTRALNRMFKDVTGRSVLDEPHRRDRSAAYDARQEWTRFEPRYALGLVTLKAERLFDPEWRLLYWPIGAPGRAGRRARAPGSRRTERGQPGSPTRFWYALCGAVAGGIALAVAGGAGACWRCCRSSSRWPRRTRRSSPSRATACRSRCWRFRSWRSR